MALGATEATLDHLLGHSGSDLYGGENYPQRSASFWLPTTIRSPQ